MKYDFFSDHRAIARVDLAAICRNFCLARQLAQRQNPKARMIAVVKCNGYGHGLLRVADALLGVGCDFFAVATPNEALSLRAAYPQPDILVLGYTPPALAPSLAKERVSQSVFSAPYAAALAATLPNNLQLTVHIKIDGGLCREGFDATDTDGILFALRQKNLTPTGLFTHFPNADTDPAATKAALGKFLACRQRLQEAGFPLFAHAAASAALLTLPESVLDGVRPGLLLYGISPVKAAFPLSPALSLWAPIQQIRSVKAGTPIGYGGDFITRRESRIGTIPLGYGDGFCRRMSGFYATLMTKKRRFSLPVCGRVSMDMTTLDLTDSPARVGDAVCLFESASAPAAHLGTIPYEILTALSPRIERVYL
ncbi:MAG: alanine racemase [Ruminococcaceae bacterium]|nr:alanine racemase [Oscillospiraceae bacterium]